MSKPTKRRWKYNRKSGRCKGTSPTTVLYKNNDKVVAKTLYNYENPTEYHTFANYGITLKEREMLLARQGNKCAVCNSKIKFGMPGGKKPIKGGASVDHCHKQEKVGMKYIRGILCHKCNHALGVVQDSTKLLYKLINYMEIHKNHDNNLLSKI